jgi:hypothetical protein
MRRSTLLALCLAGVFTSFLAVPRFGFGQGQTMPAYKAVPIAAPVLLKDPSFDAFRQQLAEITQKKDRAALARLVAATFFWIPEDADIADKNLSAIDNLAKALELDDAIGWESLAGYAAEMSATADPQRSGIFCAPGDTVFDERMATELFDETHTDGADWGFPIREGIEVRAEAKPDAPVIDRINLFLVRMLADDPAGLASAFRKVVTPLGNIGFVPVGSVLPLPGEQLCYVKEAESWKIAGFFGGETN